MEPKFKDGNCVKLIHGDSPEMTVSKVEYSPLEKVFIVECCWFDNKKNIPVTKEFKETVLKKCDENTSKAKSEDLKKMIDAFIPKRN